MQPKCESALPMEPTERDYESFRDACKLRGLAFEHDRFGNGKHKNPWTQQALCIWWSVERERQMLQNLNLSQSAEIQRLRKDADRMNGDIADLRQLIARYRERELTMGWNQE